MENDDRDRLVSALLDAIRANATILVGDPKFSASVGSYTYSFEGEDDLLHMSVARLDGAPISVEEGQWVLGFVLPNLPAGLAWLKPGHLSHHFYMGHDELLKL